MLLKYLMENINIIISQRLVDAQSRYVIEFQLQIAFNFSTFWSDFCPAV
jgi:hypothetical protein